jgi:uncharacterized membrane protein
MSIAVSLHLAGAVASLALGLAVLLRPKGDATHRSLGRIWIAAMTVVGISSLWIPTFLALSWLHLFTLLIAVSLPSAVIAIRHGRVRSHRIAMVCSFVGLCGAGLGALAPGRIVGRAVWSALGLL